VTFRLSASHIVLWGLVAWQAPPGSRAASVPNGQRESGSALAQMEECGPRASQSENETVFPLAVNNSAARALGDRLFREPRFAQFFAQRMAGNVNAPISVGDPVVADIRTAGGPLAGPFRGLAMTCRHCHLGDDFLPPNLFSPKDLKAKQIGQPLTGRVYCDFEKRSRVPDRADKLTHTTRNTPTMVNLTVVRSNRQLLHFDGEFISVEDLVADTLTGRNFGWLPREKDVAVHHVAQVIREDDGNNRLARGYSQGIPYKALLLGADEHIPNHLRLPVEYRLSLDRATDREILAAIGVLIHAYMNPLRFGQDGQGRPFESPYDVFLKKNGLPRAPTCGESDRAFAARLVSSVESLKHPRWVTADDGSLILHQQAFVFGEQELEGLKLFFDRRAGNCISCHVPPLFTDGGFHNNGTSQLEYDSLFGNGAFAALDIPNMKTRNQNVDAYLPPSYDHPLATARFRTAPSQEMPGYADLGAWNILGNPAMPKPQRLLGQLLCQSLASVRKECHPDELLPNAIALFKTPTLRDLGQSGPYFHGGSVDNIEGTIRQYISVSRLARSGKLRNGDPEIRRIQLSETQVSALSSFLRALNEDYH
jgi:cytochrome c peroxidase